MKITLTIDTQLATRTKRILASAALLSVAVVVTAAYADVPNTFAPGEVLTAADLNANFGKLVQDVTALQQQDAALETEDAMRLQAGTVGNIESGANHTLVGGAVNPTTTQMSWQTASSVQNTDANGLTTITFTTPFPNGVVNVVATHGDATFAPVFIGLLGTTTSSFQLKVNQANGAPLANAQLRFNWIAIGW